MPLSHTFIDYSSTGFFSRLFLHYLQGDESLAPFYSYPPAHDSFKKLIEEVQKASHNYPRNILAASLERQYAGVSNIHASVKKNIDLLRDNQTFTICTGHQLCLFTGPLYFLYKIISAINLAEQLKQVHPACHFVPVYWMASEDHDFAEINHVNLFGKQLIWTAEQAAAGENPPVGKLQTGSIKELLKALAGMTGNSENHDYLLTLFREAYAEHANLSDATRHIVNALFGRYGLVVLDPDDEDLKGSFAAVIRDDILHHTAHQLVSDTAEKLAASGYPVQVNPRVINFFRLTASSRNRIEKTEKENEVMYVVQHTELKFSAEEMEKEIAAHPARFSPNVVMRPLYQQWILPNIAYVGGPGELSYWLEYKTMCMHYGVVFPVLMPRNSVLWVDRPVAEKISRLGMTVTDFFKSTDELIAKYLSSETGDEKYFDKERRAIEEAFAAISDKVTITDPTLKSTAEAEKQKALNAIDAMEEKVLRALKRKHEEAVVRIKKIKDKLFPGGALQERHDNFISLYLQHGDGFIEYLKKHLDPCMLKFMIVEEYVEKSA